MANQLRSVAIAFFLAATVGSPASAAVTLLTNPNQIPPTYLNDFETTKNSGPVTFVTGELFPSSAANAGGTSSGVQGLLGFGASGIEASLASGFTSVGLFFGNDDLCCSSGYDAILSIFSGATALGSVSLTANMNDAADQFLGLSSTTPFDRVVFSNSASGSNLALYIDDFRLGASVVGAVPEPSTWAMMLLGFGAIGTVLRRRRKTTSSVRFAM